MKNKGVYLTGWIDGVNSSLPPWLLGPHQLAWAENVILRGGVAQTRPGFELVSSFDKIEFPLICQGGTIFKPKGLAPRLVLVVDGGVYTAPLPFTVFTKHETVSLDPAAKLAVLQACVKSVERNADGSLRVIAPKNVLLIQDGTSIPVVYDGITCRHTNPGAVYPETPIGLWMAWIEDRLWVSNGSQLKVGDIGDPLGFTENTYLAQRSNFALPGDCTGLLGTSDQRALLAFTSTTTTAFKSYIRSRTLWQTTEDFQRIIFNNIGCMGGKSCLNQYGLAQWFSNAGWVSLDVAMYSQLKAKLVSSDSQMIRSRSYASPDLGGIAAGCVENLLLISVPSGDRHNSQTWLRDQTPVAPGSAEGNEAWCGIWTGVRPVQWMNAEINGRQELYFVSFDYSTVDDTNIHIWKAVRPTKLDDNLTIKSQIETAMISDSILLDFKYAEIDVVELVGEVNLKAYLGGMRGPWIEIMDVDLKATEGGMPAEITETSVLRKLKAQTRTVRTQDFSPQDKAAMVEANDSVPGTDKGFQILLQWEGRMGIKGIRLVTEENATQSEIGRCQKSDTETVAIDEGGVTIT